MTPIISIRNLRKSYGSKEVLKGNVLLMYRLYSWGFIRLWVDRVMD